MSLRDARNYEVVGCVEPDLPGREYGYHDAAYINIAKVMELAMNSEDALNAEAAARGIRSAPAQETGSESTREALRSLKISTSCLKALTGR